MNSHVSLIEYHLNMSDLYVDLSNSHVDLPLIHLLVYIKCNNLKPDSCYPLKNEYFTVN